jgi:hypothetical protein
VSRVVHPIAIAALGAPAVVKHLAASLGPDCYRVHLAVLSTPWTVNVSGPRFYDWRYRKGILVSKNFNIRVGRPPRPIVEPMVRQ